MRVATVILACICALGLPVEPRVSAEPYDQYLDRLRDICSVECLPPRQFRRTARARSTDDESDLAVIMDVVAVRRAGNNFQLLSISPDGSALVNQALLGSAGVNVSGSTGIGGLPRGDSGGSHPDLIVIEMDAETLFSILNPSTPAASGSADLPESDGNGDDEIVVEGDVEREAVEPSLSALRSYFRNRRVVVRGQLRLRPVLIGARRDFRRKQVTVEVDNADDVAVLPLFNDDGEAVFSE
ncbi:hypothetical protein [Erythrobacter sp. Alg231-14]|uniref:hypothetical protein n=1 Tax=Erythrobacter sp. Alg231-14 TaxID=1922225 RepID=UPI000D561A97